MWQRELRCSQWCLISASVQQGSLTGTYEDTYYIAQRNKNLPVLPRIFHTCGKDDFLIDLARETRDLFMSFEGNPYHYVYEEHEGVHGWEYWDEHITDFLEFLHLDAPERAIAN